MNKFIFIVFLLCFSVNAHAYVDPGSGLLLLQGLFAVLGALLVFIKNPIQGVKRLIAKLRGRDEGP